MHKSLLNTANEATLQVLSKHSGGSIGILGERGSGKGFFAEQVAKTILGDELIVGKNLIQIDADDKDSGIESVRELQKELAYSISDNKKINRVVLIEHFDSFKHEAQNSMLKILEEPPQNTLIILTINDKNFVIDTVLSRLQIFTLSLVTLEKSIEFYNDFEEDEVRKAFLLSGGLSGLQHSILYDETNTVIKNIDLVKEILVLGKFERLARADKLAKEERSQTIELVDAFVKLLKSVYEKNASYLAGQQIKRSLERLEIALQTKEDLVTGISQKLALTRLFISI